MTDPVIHLRCNRTQRLYQVIGAKETPEEGTLLHIKGQNGTFWEPMRSVAEFEEIGYTRIVGDPDAKLT